MAAAPPRVRPALAVVSTALALVAVSFLGWSLYAGGPCGSSASKAADYVLAWALPAIVALAFALLVLRVRLPVALAGVALGLIGAFALWLGVVFPLCG